MANINQQEKEYVYVLNNPAFKDNLYKIGLTTRTPENRAKELCTTGVPIDYNIECAIEVSKGKSFEIEKAIHNYLELC